MEADDVLELLDEVGVVGKLEGPDAVRLQAVVAPDACNGSCIGAQVRGQCSRAPVSRAFGGLVERHANDLLHAGRLTRRPRATRARGILQQAIYTRFQKARSPARCDSAFGIECVGDLLVGDADSCQQHDARAKLNPRLDALAIGQFAQTLIIVGAEQDGLGNSHGYNLQHSWSLSYQLSSFIYGALHWRMCRLLQTRTPRALHEVVRWVNLRACCNASPRHPWIRRTNTPVNR